MFFEFVTRKYDENVSKRDYEAHHPKDIPPLESSSSRYVTFSTSPRCSVSNIDFYINKYDCSEIEKSSAQNNKQYKILRNGIYEFLLDEIHFFKEESFKK